MTGSSLASIWLNGEGRLVVLIPIGMTCREANFVGELIGIALIE